MASNLYQIAIFLGDLLKTTYLNQMFIIFFIVFQIILMGVVMFCPCDNFETCLALPTR